MLNKPHIPQPRFNYNFGSPENGILNQSIRNQLIRINQEMCLTDPCQPLNKSNLAFSLDEIFFPHSLLPIKIVYLHHSSELLSICQIGCYLFPIDFCSNKLLKFLICFRLSLNIILAPQCFGCKFFSPDFLSFQCQTELQFNYQTRTSRFLICPTPLFSGNYYSPAYLILSHGLF